MAEKKVIKQPWVFNNIPLYDLQLVPDKAIGFVYRIKINLHGKEMYYIGQKKLYSTRKKNLSKKELATITDKRLKKYKHVVTEADWQNYTGSNKELNALLSEHGEEKISLERTILCFCYSELELKYMEAKWIFIDGAMEREDFFNENISIKQIGKLKFNNG